MISIVPIFTFLFIFNILILIRTILKFIKALSQTNPSPMIMSDRERLTFWFSLSYIITFIIYK